MPKITTPLTICGWPSRWQGVDELQECAERVPGVDDGEVEIFGGEDNTTYVFSPDKCGTGYNPFPWITGYCLKPIRRKDRL